ncbi:hypothetical protein HDU99_010967, partial [Rhizoclosmatium hyalinum]
MTTPADFASESELKLQSTITAPYTAPVADDEYNPEVSFVQDHSSSVAAEEYDPEEAAMEIENDDESPIDVGPPAVVKSVPASTITPTIPTIPSLPEGVSFDVNPTPVPAPAPVASAAAAA